MEPNHDTLLFEMDIDGAAQQRLNTISKWTKFIGITVLVALILVVVAMALLFNEFIGQVSALLALDNQAMGIIIAALVVAAALCLIWIIYMLRASSFIKQGLITQSSDRIAEGFKSFKVVFVVSIIFSALGILFTLLSFLNA